MTINGGVCVDKQGSALAHETIETDIHFVRDKMSMGEIRVLNVTTSSQYSDIFLEGLATSLFTEFWNSFNLCKSHVALARGGGGFKTVCVAAIISNNCLPSTIIGSIEFVSNNVYKPINLMDGKLITTRPL